MSGNPFAGMRRDANESPVRDYLRLHGFLVWPIHGQGIPDLLLWSGAGRRFHLVEVKNPKGKNRISEAQRRTFAVFQGEQAPVHVVRSPEEALTAVREYDAAHRAITEGR